jgi:organic hydroperoxide reductase OsmC/OhrA
MSQYYATIKWENSGPDFLKNEYSREHQWIFDGGTVIAATAAPSIVPAPWSNPEYVDPEEAFIASLSSCHMLFFIHIAAQRGFLLDAYSDDAEGTMEKNSDGKVAITRVVLHPKPVFSGNNIPDEDEISSMHHNAHKDCFIANSVTTVIEIDSSS